MSESIKKSCDQILPLVYPTNTVPNDQKMQKRSRGTDEILTHSPKIPNTTGHFSGEVSGLQQNASSVLGLACFNNICLLNQFSLSQVLDPRLQRSMVQSSREPKYTSALCNETLPVQSTVTTSVMSNASSSSMSHSSKYHQEPEYRIPRVKDDKKDIKSKTGNEKPCTPKGSHSIVREKGGINDLKQVPAKLLAADESNNSNHIKRKKREQTVDLCLQSQYSPKRMLSSTEMEDNGIIELPMTSDQKPFYKIPKKLDAQKNKKVHFEKEGSESLGSKTSCRSSTTDILNGIGIPNDHKKPKVLRTADTSRLQEPTSQLTKQQIGHHESLQELMDISLQTQQSASPSLPFSQSKKEKGSTVSFEESFDSPVIKSSGKESKNTPLSISKSNMDNGQNNGGASKEKEDYSALEENRHSSHGSYESFGAMKETREQPTAMSVMQPAKILEDAATYQKPKSSPQVATDLDQSICHFRYKDKTLCGKEVHNGERLCLEHQKAPNCLKLKLGLSSPKLDSKTTEESSTGFGDLGIQSSTVTHSPHKHLPHLNSPVIREEVMLGKEDKCGPSSPSDITVNSMVAVSPSEDSVQQAVSQSSVMPSTPKTPSVPETTLANLISIGSLDCGGFRNPLGLNETSSEVAECQDDHCESEEVLVDISSSSSAPMKVRLAELNRQEQNVQVALIETGDELSRITKEMTELEKKLSSMAATKKQLKKERDELTKQFRNVLELKQSLLI